MKKEHTIIIRKRIRVDGYNVYNEGNSDRLFILSMFLYFEISTPSSYDLFASWLKGEFKWNGIGGNLYTLSGCGPDVIIRKEYSYLEEEGNYKRFYFKTSKKHLLEIIRGWLLAYVRVPRPQKMMIIQEDDGSIVFKALDVEGEEIKVEKEFTVKENFLRLLYRLKKKFFG